VCLKVCAVTWRELARFHQGSSKPALQDPTLEPLQNLVIWAGPVSAANLAGAALPAPARVLTVNHGDGGIGSTAFGNLGRRFGGDLAEFCGSRGVDLDRCQTVTLAAFSAGFALLETFLRNPDSAARVDALVAGDAYYTGPNMAVKPGYASFCARAAAGRALAVLSTSAIAGPDYPSSQAALAPLMAPLDLRPVRVPDAIPEPASAVAIGGLYWLRYGTKYGVGRPGHVMHAARVVPAVLSAMVTPYLQNRAGLDGKDPSGAGAALAAAGLIVALTENL